MSNQTTLLLRPVGTSHMGGLNSQVPLYTLEKPPMYHIMRHEQLLLLQGLIKWATIDRFSYPYQSIKLNTGILKLTTNV